MQDATVIPEVGTRTIILRLPPIQLQRGDTRPDLERLTEVCDRLDELAGSLERVADAVQRGEGDARVRRRVDRSRDARARLQRSQALAQEARPPQDMQGLEIMKRMRAAADRLRPAEAALNRWLQRPQPGLAELMKQPDGAAAVVDALLLPAWRFEYDVAILMGADCAPLIRELRDRGQCRVVSWLRDDEEQEGLPAGVFVVRDRDDLVATLQTFHDPFPAGIVGRPLHDWTVTLGEAQDVQNELLDGLERTVAMQNTVRHFGALWSRQSMKNLPHVARWPSIAGLRGPLEGKPLVIVAPGPSLARNVHLLKQLKGRAVICTYSRTLQSLAEAGVVPDMVLVLDPLDLRYHFDGFPVEEIEALVLGLSVNPGIFEMPAKRVITFSGNSTVEQWIYGALDEDMLLETSCSVATSAVSMAHEWGCDPVILVGQDLAFTDNKLYDASAADGDAEVADTADGDGFKVSGLGENARAMEQAGDAHLSAYKRLPEVPAWGGGTVRTSPNFSWVLAWLGERATRWGGEASLINATEGGAHIEGMEHIPLAEAIQRIEDEPLDVPTLLDEMLARTDRRARARTLLARIEEVQAGLSAANRLARQCLDLVGRDQPTDKQLRKLQRLEEELNAALQPAKVVISLFGQAEIVEATERARDATTLAENLDASRELFRVVRTAHEKGYPRLEAAVQAIRAQLR